jgi:hypothetical protein
MRSRPNTNSSSGSSAVSNTPAAMNVVSAGNRRGSVSWLSIRGYDAIHSSLAAAFGLLVRRHHGRLGGAVRHTLPPPYRLVKAV